MADAGDRAEADHHLLVDDEHGDQQQQHPEQAGAVVLARRGVDRDPAGVVVPDHDDEAGPHDRGQGEGPPAPAARGAVLLPGDGPEGSPDVALMGVVEDGGAARPPRAREPLLDQAGPPAARCGTNRAGRPLRGSRRRQTPVRTCLMTPGRWGITADAARVPDH